jgi:Spy/CpxP family protein refolding chaperone
MKRSPGWLTAAILFVLVVASAGVGFQIGVRRGMMRSPGSSLDFTQRLIQRLRLTPEQQAQLAPDIQRAQQEVKSTARGALEKARTTRSRLHDALRPLLTPEQLAELEELRAEQEQIRLQVEKAL